MRKKGGEKVKINKRVEAGKLNIREREGRLRGERGKWVPKIKKIAFSTGPVNLKIAPGLLTPSVCTGL